MLYFRLQTSGSMSHIPIPSSKSRLFPHGFKHSRPCLPYLSTKLLAALAPSDTPLQPLRDTPWRGTTQLLRTRFSFLSARGPSYSYMKGQSTPPTMVKNRCTVSARQRRTLELGQWTTGYERRAASCLRQITGRWRSLAAKHTSYPWREQGW